MTNAVFAVDGIPKHVREADQRLAWELTAQITPIPDILKRHGMSFDSLKAKLREPMFRSLVKETKKLWNSELSTKERIRVKAALLVEDSMLEIYQILQNADLNPNARIEAFETLVGIADLKPDKGTANAGERIAINITIPGVERPVVIQHTPALEAK